MLPQNLVAYDEYPFDQEHEEVVHNNLQQRINLREGSFVNSESQAMP